MFGFGKKRPDDPTHLSQPVPPGWTVVDLGLLGAGGMSQVFRVKDTSLEREMALKVMRPELAKEPAARDRFIEEGRITAQLDHPNIPPVYSLSADPKAAVCFTMKVLEGKSLQQILEENEREGIDGLSAALDVMVRVCDAVAFAHSKGVLHLDLKPTNVMVGEFGQIYVVDWGLARRKAELPTKEKDHGWAYGTPAYMAPEQALGENWRLDERTDVYSLGGMVYRILAGRPPYLGHTADSTQDKAKRGALVPPDQLEGRATQQLPRRLVAICLKAMAADPAGRYQSVAELKHDLEDFIRGVAQLPQQTFQAGQVIVREGEPGDTAYIVLEGHAQASRTVAGSTQQLRLLGPGEMFGETAVLTGATRSATVTALMDTTVAVVDASYLHEEMERSSFISLAVRRVASSFLDLNAQSSALLEEQQALKAVELALRALALEGVDGEGGSRRVRWAPLHERLVAEVGLPPDAISERLARQSGMSVSDDGWLVLAPLPKGP